MTHPPHPESASTSSKASFDSNSSHTERDPHNVPTFDNKQIETPVLYLPPLLSSLPERFDTSNEPENSPFSPLATQTRLPDIDPASLSLHKALHPISPSKFGILEPTVRRGVQLDVPTPA